MELVFTAFVGSQAGKFHDRGRCAAQPPNPLKGDGTMIHELRIYECVPGRLPALNRRFETITLKLWEKHGIRQTGFWTTLIGRSNQTLFYLLEWESLAERERKWNAFMADPEWQKARAETEKDGPIVARVTNEILTPTPYSKIR